MNFVCYSKMYSKKPKKKRKEGERRKQENFGHFLGKNTSTRLIGATFIQLVSSMELSCRSSFHFQVKDQILWPPLHCFARNENRAPPSLSLSLCIYIHSINMNQTKKEEKNIELIEMIPGSLFFTLRIRTWVGVA